MQKPSSDLSEDGPGVVDLQAFVETLKRRWWVVPICLTLSLATFWVQETDLKRQPGSYRVTKTFEARDGTGALALVGIDASLIRQYPDSTNQLSILQSEATREKILKSTGLDGFVNITRSKPTFTLIENMQSNEQSTLLFESSGSPTVTFACTEEVRSDCATLIDAYVEEFDSIRRAAQLASLSFLRQSLEKILMKTTEPSLELKLVAIEALLTDSPPPLSQISTYEEAVGPTLVSVRRPTYLFAIGAALFIALLIVLQSAISDNKIRSPRDLKKLLSHGQYLGQLTSRNRTADEFQVTMSLGHACYRRSQARISCYTLGNEFHVRDSLERIADSLEVDLTVRENIHDSRVRQLITSTDQVICILLVVRGKDEKRVVAATIAALSQLPNESFAGSILIT